MLRGLAPGPTLTLNIFELVSVLDDRPSPRRRWRGGRARQERVGVETKGAVTLSTLSARGARSEPSFSEES